MGIRIYFSRGATDGALGHFLSAPLHEFRSWYVGQWSDEEEAIIEADAWAFPLIDRIIADRAQALIPGTLAQARLIDHVTNTFYFWCNWERQDLLVEAHGSTFKIHRYGNTKAIQKRFGDEALRLWNYMLHGRPIGREDAVFPYNPPDDVYRLGYWTHEEVAYLRECMLPEREYEFLRSFDYEASLAVNTTFEAIENVYSDGLGLITEVA